MRHALLTALLLSACAKDSVPPPAIHADTAVAPSANPTPLPNASPTIPTPNATPNANPLPSAAPTPSNGPRLVLAAAEGDVATIVRAQRVKALEEKRILVVYVGADWCPPCKHFKNAVANHEFDAKFADYTFLEFNLDRDGERLLQAGYGSKFIPLYVLPGPDAKRKDSFQVSEVKNRDAAMKLVAEGLEKFRGQ
jgi:thiol-disulfide isomerase/thioredoxin